MQLRPNHNACVFLQVFLSQFASVSFARRNTYVQVTFQDLSLYWLSIFSNTALSLFTRHVYFENSKLSDLSDHILTSCIRFDFIQMFDPYQQFSPFDSRANLAAPKLNSFSYLKWRDILTTFFYLHDEILFIFSYLQAM